MKKEFSTCPDFMANEEMYGFDWKEHLLAIPAPLVTVTTYKSNGLTNATMQSWLAFTNSDGLYCIFADVNKGGHMYRTIKERKGLVINFPSADVYMSCHATILHNQDGDDEIGMAGLTAEPATMVDAPRIEECFLNLECEYAWEHEVSPGSYHTVLCVKIVNVVMDEAHYNESLLGRYGDTGYLYNIHSPRNPETGEEEETCVGTIHPYATYQEL